MKSNSKQLVVVSDLHVGSWLGLCPPKVQLDDGGIIQHNQLQKEAWEFWNSFWAGVWKRKLETVALFNGDLVDGQVKQSHQVWSTNPQEQIRVASEILSPVVNRAKSSFVVRGTPAHVGNSGSSDDAVAREIGATKVNHARSSYHLKLEVAGALFDVAHQGPSSGTRVWSYGNGLRSFAKTIVFDAMAQHTRPPDVIIRSHFHHRTHETIRDYGHKCEAIITPSWQWKSEYAHKVVSHEDIADVGGVIITVADGKIENIEIELLSLSQSDWVKA